MPEESPEPDKKPDLVGAAVELAKTAYDDALKPMAAETGKALGVVGRAVNAVLLPLKGLVWGFEQIGQWTEKKVAEVLEARKVPPERVVTPEPTIAVPAIEALRYSNMREEFARLLATAMDSKTKDTAHPAFVEILKQITPVEAQIINALRTPYHTAYANWYPHRLENTSPGVYISRSMIIATSEGRALLVNLERLGIVQRNLVVRNRGFTDLQEALKVSVESYKELPDAKVEANGYKLTSLGTGFRRACIADGEPGPTNKEK